MITPSARVDGQSTGETGVRPQDLTIAPEDTQGAGPSRRRLDSTGDVFVPPSQPSMPSALKASSSKHVEKHAKKSKDKRARFKAPGPRAPLLTDARAECILTAARKIGRVRAGIAAGLVRGREREERRAEAAKKARRRHNVLRASCSGTTLTGRVRGSPVRERRGHRTTRALWRVRVPVPVRLRHRLGAWVFSICTRRGHTSSRRLRRRCVSLLDLCLRIRTPCRDSCICRQYLVRRVDERCRTGAAGNSHDGASVADAGTPPAGGSSLKRRVLPRGVEATPRRRGDRQ
ncbi:uncharacterized protein B0H18DRAFT_625894 [Fomitopsis serialis]|uniref:uncharacterized protein n=1 Tax=Fomitopsis serialis TaxID=139415 RepID=UPI0020073C14|nr:uncharacterized protein B0H18DRAFT_625894 [Neoantrodia serialis]KAH9919713.1 hypothetical protein B0H18DRAFT_625894 [Neoantrodia serialis]